MDIDVRPLSATDFDEMFAVECYAFSDAPKPPDRAQAEATMEWDRMFGAFDGSTLCGTAGAYGFDLTLPGQVATPASGVTAVAVLPTHRRRGVLTAMMRRQLEDVAARGEALAILTASEATIYGRFGYGVATEYTTAEIRRARSGFVGPRDEALPLRLITKAEAIELAPAWHDAMRRVRVGEVTRPASWWPVIFGDEKTWKGGGDIFVVACEPTDGRVGGYAIYKVDHEKPNDESWLHVVEVVAADRDVAGALWRFLFDVDLMDTIEVELATDDELRFRLADWRGFQAKETSDFVWTRVVDPAAALATRRYPIADAFVIDLEDPFLPANSGRYRVEGGPDGAEVTRLDGEGGEQPDLAMGISALGSIYLGGFGVARLAQARRIVARSSDVVARADRFFATGGPVAHCSTGF